MLGVTSPSPQVLGVVNPVPKLPWTPWPIKGACLSLDCDVCHATLIDEDHECGFCAECPEPGYFVVTQAGHVYTAESRDAKMMADKQAKPMTDAHRAAISRGLRGNANRAKASGQMN